MQEVGTSSQLGRSEEEDQGRHDGEPSLSYGQATAAIRQRLFVPFSRMAIDLLASCEAQEAAAGAASLPANSPVVAAVPFAASQGVVPSPLSNSQPSLMPGLSPHQQGQQKSNRTALSGLRPLLEVGDC